ncbi:hypothetical protein ZIOFF_059768 [Zingiber officinale]|uniref:Uncharacterized protein n=1 Tax=Zingiber officinale TaxID=94328 RepID=A0A8J5FBQ1_ZINOF|nr:hypothetical protein ZIOFF_059768 [Zingiber officinale]
MAAEEDNEGGNRFQPLCALEEVEQGTMHEEAKLNRDEKEINLIEDGGILRVGSEQTVAGQNEKVENSIRAENAELPTACVSSMGKRLAVCQLNQMADNVEQSGGSSSFLEMQVGNVGVGMSKSFMDTDESDTSVSVHLQRSSSLSDFSSVILEKLMSCIRSWSSNNLRLLIKGLNWMLPCDGFGLHKLQFKLKRLKAHLKWWNTGVFGNIHDKVKQAEEEFSIAQKSFDLDPNEVNKLNMAKKQASLFQTLYMEETFWKQKAAVRWMGEGDRNTKFFHSMVQKRRMANRIFRIWNEGICLDKPELIQVSGADFFKDLFTGEEFDCTEIDMEHIPSLISANDNSVLCALPSVEVGIWLNLGEPSGCYCERDWLEKSWMVGTGWSHQGHVREVIPFLIIWFLWVACNDAKHRAKLLGIHAEIKSINIVAMVKWQKP